MLYPKEILARLRMLVEYGIGERQHQRALWRPVRRKMRAWAEFHNGRKEGIPPLAYREGGDFILIRQERPGQPVLHHRLSGLSRKIYLACRTPASKKTLLRSFKSITEEQLHVFLDDLESKRLLYRDKGRCLALAVRQPHTL